MKKLLALMLIGVMTVSFAACGSSESTEEVAETTAVEEAVEEAEEEVAAEVEEEAEAEEVAEEAEEAEEDAVAVMTYAEYAAADLDTEVVIETYVQAKQSWWDDKATVYTQDEDGAYFLYNMACSEEDYELLTVGTKIRVSGWKSEWSGEVEITDATFEIIDGSFVADALDVTDLLESDDLIDYQNQYVAFSGMTVEDSGDGAAFLYAWDGSGSHDANSDLYFTVSYNGVSYTFTVESYLCSNSTDVYAAVESLQVGDVIDMTGFLYWYNGVNPHITSVTVQ